MFQSSNFLVLGLGFILGLKYATDPDHIVAVTLYFAGERLAGAIRLNQMSTGRCSCIFGVYLAVTAWLRLSRWRI